MQIVPEDRAAWRNLGRVYYLDGEFDQALSALDQVLKIDPEDRATHYHRMLVFRATGRKGEAQIAERAYLKYQIDESAREDTKAFLLENPEIERAAQRIQIHTPKPYTVERGSHSSALSATEDRQGGKPTAESR